MSKRLSRLGSQISNKIGKAIGAYNLIEAGDKILIGISGGKDSLTLLTLLKERQRWAPVKYDLHAAYISSNAYRGDAAHKKALKKIFEELEIPYSFDKISIQYEKKKANCFWCSWNRRKALFDLAEELECNKLALGHHKDDIVETTLLNMFFLGDFSTMNPRQEIFEGKLVIIRPLVYCEEKETAKFAHESNFPTLGRTCPYGLDTNRKYIKSLINSTQKRIPVIKNNIFRSISRIREDYINIIDMPQTPDK